MSDDTGIEWTDATWNPIRGCSRVSEGCRHCYAERVAARFSGPGMPYEGLVKFGKQSSVRDPRWTDAVRFLPELLAQPLQRQGLGRARGLAEPAGRETGLARHVADDRIERALARVVVLQLLARVAERRGDDAFLAACAADAKAGVFAIGGELVGIEQQAPDDGVVELIRVNPELEKIFIPTEKMSVHDAREILGGAVEFHCHHALGDQFRHAGTHHVHPEDAIGFLVGDDLLRLIFIACHPVLPTEARVAAMLKGTSHPPDTRFFSVTRPEMRC